MSRYGIVDEAVAALSRGRREESSLRVRGLLRVELAGPARRQVWEFENLVTQVGDQYYGERAIGLVGAPAQVSGMRLGSGTTTPSKTGAGAAIVAYISGSSVAISGGYPQSSLAGSSRRISWQAQWAAGVATHAAIAEVVLTNEASLTNVAGTAANTIARALLSPTVNKGVDDVLTITWHQDLLGA